MKTATEVSPEKLRGGFYTPEPLVDICLSRLADLTRTSKALSVLEPAAGDGAFVKGLLNRWPGGAPVRDITAIELIETEAARCRKLLTPTVGRAVNSSVLPWALNGGGLYDAAVGNPPFVRFQFVSSQDRRAATELAERLGVSIKGVANLWIPVLLAALSRLRKGGAFAFVVPTECLTGSAAGRIREWLLLETSSLRLDLFPAGSFPAVLQEVAVLSGRASRPKQGTLTIVQHDQGGSSKTWNVKPPLASTSWTPYLLETSQRDALEDISQRPFVRRLGELAKFEVSIVTGANDFFAVDDATLSGWGLEAWREPHLSRIRHAPGLVFGKQEHSKMRRHGVPAWLLNFSADRPDPTKSRRSAEYISRGEQRGLAQRFKCRIREPWYRVPNFQRGDLLLSKRSHLIPRVVLNEAGVYTTDTIYRGKVLPVGPEPRSLTACFHNSLTVVSAELEGRSFGGGVLELVPSEVGRIWVPRLDSASGWLPRLDGIAREGGPEALIEATDAGLIEAGLLGREDVEILSSARRSLLHRRLERNSARPDPPEQMALAA